MTSFEVIKSLFKFRLVSFWQLWQQFQPTEGGPGQDDLAAGHQLLHPLFCELDRPGGCFRGCDVIRRQLSPLRQLHVHTQRIQGHHQARGEQKPFAVPH